MLIINWILSTVDEEQTTGNPSHLLHNTHLLLLVK